MMRFYLSVLLVLTLVSGISLSHTNDDCLMCHEDPEMTMDKGRRKISLWLDNSKFIKSAHKNVQCFSCHKGFNPNDIPHKSKIEPVDCKSCHIDVEKQHTFHPWMQSAPLKDNCKNCHTYHTVSPVNVKNSNVGGINAVEKCGLCHKDIKAEYMKSEHFKVLQKISSENAPDCNYCHRNPITKGWEKNYRIRKDNQNNVCIGCHKSDTHNPEVLKKVDNNESRHAKLRKTGKEHAAVCTDCHGFHQIQKNDDFEARLNPKNSAFACGKCHVHISQEYQNSIHGLAQMKGNMNAASCVSCHFEHKKNNQRNMVDEVVYADNLLNKEFSEKSQITTCISCHTNDSLMQTGKLKSIEDAHNWLPGLKKHFETVSCYECHSSYTEPYISHNILPLNKSVRNCNTCHDKSVELKSVLYNFQKGISVEKEGLIEGNIKGNANFAGLAKNIILDYLSLILLGGIVFGLLIHSYIRWYFNKGRMK